MSDINERSDEDIAKIQAELGANPKPDAGAGDGQSGEYIPNPEQPTQPESVTNEQLAGAVAMMVQMGTTFIAARMGEHWAATPEESQMMGSAYAEAIEYYYPDAEVGAGVAAIMVTGMYALPRMAIHKQKTDKEKAKGESDGNQSK